MKPKRNQRRLTSYGWWYDLIAIADYIPAAEPGAPSKAVWSCLDGRGCRIRRHEDQIAQDQIIERYTPEYPAVERWYGSRTAVRSGLPFMRHIDQGLLVLQELTDDMDVLRAWCVHPLFQVNEFFEPMMKQSESHVAPLINVVSNPRVVVFAMEYRAVANAFLSTDHDYVIVHEGTQRPRISVLPQVNQMLLADKIQNYRDARLHVFSKVSADEAKSLDNYFHLWFSALGVGGWEVARYEAILEKAEKEIE